MGVNVVHLIGNLGHDPELRETASGTPVLNMRLAVNERRKGPDGEWAEAVEWVSVTAWGRTAENVTKFLNKGSHRGRRLFFGPVFCPKCAEWRHSFLNLIPGFTESLCNPIDESGLFFWRGQFIGWLH